MNRATRSEYSGSFSSTVTAVKSTERVWVLLTDVLNLCPIVFILWGAIKVLAL